MEFFMMPRGCFILECPHFFTYEDVMTWKCFSYNWQFRRNSCDGTIRYTLTHWSRDKMAAISQTTIWNAFSWMKIYEFRLIFHWSLFLRVEVSVPALVQIMAWRRPGDKPLSEPMMIILLTHICVTRPQWVNGGASILYTYYKYTNVTFESMLQDTSGEYGDIASYVLTMSFMFYSQSKPGIHESPVLSEVEL